MRLVNRDETCQSEALALEEIVQLQTSDPSRQNNVRRAETGAGHSRTLSPLSETRGMSNAEGLGPGNKK